MTAMMTNRELHLHRHLSDRLLANGVVEDALHLHLLNHLPGDGLGGLPLPRQIHHQSLPSLAAVETIGPAEVLVVLGPVVAKFPSSPLFIWVLDMVTARPRLNPAHLGE